jgi:hypothetical protein
VRTYAQPTPITIDSGTLTATIQNVLRSESQKYGSFVNMNL